jgi:protein-tyrosine phosphatase
MALVTRPRGGDWLEDEVSGWRRAGIDVAVSLLEEDEAAQLELGQEASAAKAQNIRFHSFPIPDRGVPASTKDALLLLDRLAAELDEGKNIAIHCRQSVGRSGLIAAGLLLKSGMSVDDAIGVVSAARQQTIPETPVQLRWLQHLPHEHLALTQ